MTIGVVGDDGEEGETDELPACCSGERVASGTGVASSGSAAIADGDVAECNEVVDEADLAPALSAPESKGREWRGEWRDGVVGGGLKGDAVADGLLVELQVELQARTCGTRNTHARWTGRAL